MRELLVRQRLSDEDSIIEFLGDESGSVKLTERQQKKLDRMDFADNMLRTNFKRIDYTVEVMLKKWPELSRNQARRDIMSSQYIFGSLLSKNKKYNILIAADMLLQAYESAKLKKDPYAMISAGKEYGKLFGAGKEEGEIPKFEDFAQITVIELATAKSLGLPAIQNLQERIITFKRKKELSLNTSNIPEAELSNGTD